MKKRLIALLLAAAILLSTAPAAAADSSLALQSMQSGRCGSSAAWTLNLDTGTLRIFGFGAMDDFESYQTEVPWYAYRNSIQTVAVGIGITSIGYSAFRDCANLTRVSISNTVKRIESCAFMGCTSLAEIVLPNSVTWLGGSMFYDCVALTHVTLSNKITELYDMLFYGCSALEQITVPASVVSVEEIAPFCSNLRSIYFEGAAPHTIAEISGVDSSGKPIYANHSLPQSCTLYFRQGAEGWTAPSWRGCKTAVWGNPPQQDNGASSGLNPAKGQVYITAFSQNKACVPSDAQLTITWNTPVEKASGCIRILDSSNREVYSLEVSSGAVSVSGAAMSFSLAAAPLRYGQTYSIKLDNGIVKSQAGVYFHGLEAGTWIITIDRPADTVNMSWAQKPFWKFGGNDYDKPPIPDGTDTQYANQLLLWAQDAGYYGLTLQQCLAMLDAPMYFPVTDQNQTPLLLNDRATTVRQVVEDILFVEALQERIQEQITEPLSDVSLSKAASNPWLLLTSVIPEETKIYETAISWYDQIETYMGQRNHNSNFFLSLGAPAAYVALCEALGMTGDVLKPMLKADFESFTEQQFMHSLNHMADYATFSDSVDEIKLAYRTGKVLYTAVSRNHLGSVVSLGADCLKSYFGASESPVLQEISNSWNTATDTYSAAKNSILLGSSIGMFPLVIELRNGIVNDLKKQVKAAYLIGDYYIAQEEPALYRLIFGVDGFLHSTNYFASQTTDLRHHRTIVSAAFAQSFAPSVQL